MGRDKFPISQSEATDAISNVISEIGDEAVKALVSDTLLGHILLLGATLATHKAISAIRDHLLLRKMKQFLVPLKDVPREDRIDMVRRLEADTVYRDRVGDSLVELLDGLEGRYKARMIGEVFKAFASKRIELRMLRRLTTAVERIQIIDIAEVRKLTEATQGPPEGRLDRFGALGDNSVNSLLLAGFCTSGSSLGGGGMQLTTVGQCFLDLGLDRLCDAGRE